jgi:hypothetical protein
MPRREPKGDQDPQWPQGVPGPVASPPSDCFVAIGDAGKAIRTLKEQVIHGRIFKNVEEIRTAVTAFADLYNRQWRLERLGFMSPHEARQAYALREAA